MHENELGKKISYYRNELGYTQEKLADLCAVSNVAVSRWESGANYPDITTLPILARIFNTTIDHLLNFEKELTQEATIAFVNECIAKFQTEDFETAFIHCKNLLHTYPNNELLTLRLCCSYPYVAIMTQDETQQNAYREFAKEHLTDICESMDLQLKQAACINLSNIYMMEQDYELAQQALNKLPVLQDTSSMLAHIYVEKHEYEQAYQIYQSNLMKRIQEIELELMSLSNLASQCGDQEDVAVYLKLQNDVATLFNTKDVFSFEPIAERFVEDKALAIEHVRKYIYRLKNFDQMIDHMRTRLHQNIWFRHVEVKDANIPTNLWDKEKLMALLEEDTLDYLRDEPAFQELVDEIRQSQ